MDQRSTPQQRPYSRKVALVGGFIGLSWHALTNRLRYLDLLRGAWHYPVYFFIGYKVANPLTNLVPSIRNINLALPTPLIMPSSEDQTKTSQSAASD
jgi:hypothetical protein